MFKSEIVQILAFFATLNVLLLMGYHADKWYASALYLFASLCLIIWASMPTKKKSKHS